MRRLLTYLGPYRWAVAAAVGLFLLLTPLELAGPWLVKTAIDRYIKAGDLGGLGLLAVLYVTVALGVLVVKYVQLYLTQWVGQKAMLDLRMAIFAHVQRLP